MFKERFETFLLLFIILQPVLDLFTALSIFAFKVDLTIGVFVRFIVMFLGVLYVFFIKDRESKRKTIVYLLILGVFFAISLANNLLVKQPISVFSEGKYIAKLVYMTVLFYSYLYVFKSFRSKEGWDKKVQAYIFYSMMIIGAVMIISSITGTGIKSYESIKLGHQGWFFAGNELGAVMAISFGVVVLYAIRKTTSFKTSYYWIPVLIMIYSLVALGTKVGYGAVLIILVIAFVMTLFELIKNRKQQGNRADFVNLVISGVFILGFVLATPFTPVAFNTNLHLQWVGVDKEKIDNKTVGKDDISEEGFEDVMLSGRQEFLTSQKGYYEDAPIMQKLFGMGYGGNYEETPKMIEMDFYDLFYSFGMIGFGLFLLPFFLAAIKLFFAVLKDFRRQFNRENILIASGIVLGLGTAYTAGHVFFAPAVSIYMVILIAYLMIKLDAV